MKKLISVLDKALIPVLSLASAAIFLILLAVTDGGKVGLLLAMAASAVMMAGMRWSVGMILRSAAKRTTRKEFRILVRIVEALMLLLFAAFLVGVILLWDVPPVWLFCPVPLFGLAGALRFDAGE